MPSLTLFARPVGSGAGTPAARVAAFARRARAARLRVRALAGALALAASAGCGAITESEGASPDDLVGRYALTHFNDAPVPAVMEENDAGREELVAGSLDVQPDRTFAMRVTERDTDKQTGAVYEYAFTYGGTVAAAGGAVRLTITAEDGEVAAEPWTVTGQLREGSLRVDFGDGDERAVVTFRRR